MENGGLGRGPPLCATGVYMSAADVERVKRERERGWETVPPHSSPPPPFLGFSVKGIYMCLGLLRKRNLKPRKKLLKL